MGQLVLSQAVEEVALVLVRVAAFEQPPARAVAILDDVDPRVVAGCDAVSAVEVPRTTQERAELHGGVAVDAGLGVRPSR